ncbi:S8 family peptidase, partial [Streptomyces sp. NPDC059718]
MILGENSGNGLPGHYIVSLKDTPNVKELGVRKVAEVAARDLGGKLGDVWATGLHGFAVDMPPAAARRLASDPDVSWVQEQQMYHIEDDQSPLQNWGLDRIDQRTRPSDNLLNNHYGYMGSGGSGVHVYSVDTGIRITHPEFEGRASYGINTVGGDPANADDCNGHGTRTAGVVGSKDYGVAKKVSLVAVKVFDCGGTGPDPQVIAGLQWIENHAIKPAVVNLSLGPTCKSGGVIVPCLPGTSQGIVTEEQNLINAGIPVVTAAGNEGLDACSNPVGAAPGTITVGGVAPAGYNSGDGSNFGSCVDIWAPGESITSVGGVGRNSSGVLDPDPITKTGTSEAAPFVTGAVAMFQGTPQFANATPAQISAQIDANATLGIITGLPDGQSPNKLLYIPPSLEGSSVAVAKISSGTLSGALEAFGADAGGKML